MKTCVEISGVGHFKKGSTPQGKTNLIVCSPTLEILVQVFLCQTDGRPVIHVRSGLIINSTIMPIPIGMICRAWITISGVRYYASDYGLRAFCFFPSKNGDSKGLSAKIRKIKKATSVKK